MTDFGYKVRIKEEIINALRSAFNDGSFPNRDILGKVQIILEYPVEEVQYPAIMVDLEERAIHIAGVGHYELSQNEIDKNVLLAHWRFEAGVRFSIFALTSADRDILSSALVNMIAFPGGFAAYKIFHTKIFDSEYIDMQMIADHITPTGDSVGDVPWDDPTRKLYQAGYSLDIMGEFYATHDTGDLVTITDVKIYPYRADQQVPTGSTDPRDANVPWV